MDVVGVARDGPATQPERRDVLAALPRPGEDRLALGLREGPLRIPLDDAQPRAPSEGDRASPERHDAGKDLGPGDHQPAGGWTPATAQRPWSLSIERSSIVATCSVFTGSVTPPMTWPYQKATRTAWEVGVTPASVIV